MKTLYVHIGTHKTATTTIQFFCDGNRELLASRGICYPPSPFYYFNKSAEKNGMFLGTKYYDTDWVRHTDVEEERLEKGLGFIKETFSKYDNILLSQESLFIDFYREQLRPLKRLKEHSELNGYRLRFILYLRRQDQFIESWWNQVIKMTWYRTDDFPDYLDRYVYLDYCEMLKQIESVVGKDAIRVKRFSDAVKGEGVLSDFMNEIGLELTDEYVIEHEESNTKLPGNTVSIKQTINGIGGITGGENRFLNSVLTDPALPCGDLYPCSEFSEEERSVLMSRYEEGNAYIAERYIGDGKPLFSNDYSGKPKRTEDNPEYLRDIIRTSFYADIKLRREFNETIKEQNRTIRRLERRIASLERRLDHIKHPVKWLIEKNTAKGEPADPGDQED